MTDIRSKPCSACPYRQDCPSGLWAAHEYEKLRPYDNITPDQPWAPFMCHATPRAFCNGWAITHTRRGREFDLLALRMNGYPEIPAETEPLFASGNEAADWGQRDIEDPSDEAMETVARLLRKYPRLRDED
jgi:hypothetical protein